MHPKDEEALQMIDAAIFTGDPSPEDTERIQYFCDRWSKRTEVPSFSGCGAASDAEALAAEAAELQSAALKGEQMARIRLDTGKAEKVVMERANVLLIGDEVNLFADQPGAAFGWGTVVCVTEEYAEVVRPYVHTADFSMSAGQGETGERLISYIGQEVTRLDRASDRLLTVVFRSTVPK